MFFTVLAVVLALKVTVYILYFVTWAVFSSFKVLDELQITDLPILKKKNLEFDLKMWRCLKNKLDTTFVTFHWVGECKFTLQHS